MKTKRSWIGSRSDSTCSSASSSHEQAESLMDEEPYYQLCGSHDDDELSYTADYGEEEEDSLQEGGEMELLDEESEAASSLDDDQSLADEESLTHLLNTGDPVTHLLNTGDAVTNGDPVSYRVSLVPHVAPVLTVASSSAATTDTSSLLERSGPLTPSLFSYCPPSIHFPLHNEPCEL